MMISKGLDVRFCRRLSHIHSRRHKLQNHITCCQKHTRPSSFGLGSSFRVPPTGGHAPTRPPSCNWLCLENSRESCHPSLTREYCVNYPLAKKGPSLPVVSTILCKEASSQYSDSISGNKVETNTIKTIFSGIQPSGVLHLGNYFGAVRQWVKLQEEGHKVILCVVDLHAITLPQDPKTFHSQILRMAASLLACGVDPVKSVLFQQSRISEHVQFSWVLGCLTTMARLAHLPQYKEKSAMLKEVPLGLCVYPVLQAADILLYRATHVPVGEDQVQHIQLAAHLARVFNNRYGSTFRMPHSIVYDDTTSRVRSLRQPTKKMSKSEPDSRSRVELTDTPEVILEKVKKSVTDFTSEVFYDPVNRPGVSNLMGIHSVISGKGFHQIQQECQGIDTGKYKMVVADLIIQQLNPIRMEMEHLLRDKTYLLQVLDDGATQAKTIASQTWLDVRRKVGLLEKV